MRYYTLLCAIVLFTNSLASQSVVITIDDLPINGSRGLSNKEILGINEKVINHCTNYDVPAIGFVNEGRLTDQDVLTKWIDAGLELGNHTYSHPSFYKTDLEAFQQEVIKGEIITKKLLESRGKEINYFRHPFLNTGSDSLSKAKFELFLATRGYTIAPVTVESSDYIFNKLYLDAYLKKDSDSMAIIGEAYVAYTKEMFEHMEVVASETQGRAIPQIFLCHVNLLNADYLDEILDFLTERNYEFIDLNTALLDPVFENNDHYIGPWGFSWLYRWEDDDPSDRLKAEPTIDTEILDKYRN